MSGKRANGEGSIYQRADGRWGASAFLETTSGKRKRVHIYGKTRQEVHDRLADKLGEARKGIRTPDKEWTVAAYLDYWLRNVATPKNRPRTIELYEGYIRLYLKPALGHIRLTKLTIQHVQTFLNRRLEEGSSERSVHQMRSTLRAALSRAEREELIVRNVAKLVEIKPWIPKPIHPWTAEEATRFLGVAKKHRLYPAFAMLLLYGMRRGEVLGIRWCDVDFEHGQLHIRQQLQRIGKTLEQGPVKTSAGRRDLPLLSEIENELATLYKRRFGAPPAALDEGDPVGRQLVFLSTTSTPIDPKNFVRSFRGLCKQNDIRLIRVHDTRHTAATLLKNLGVPARDAQLILGHSNVTTTQQLYQHADLEGQAKALAKIERQLLAVDVAAKSAANMEFSTGEGTIFRALTPGGPGGARTLDTLLKRTMLSAINTLPTPVIQQLRTRTYAHILGWVAVKKCCKLTGSTDTTESGIDSSILILHTLRDVEMHTLRQRSFPLSLLSHRQLHQESMKGGPV